MLVEQLYNAGINGWFSSYDDKVELEICMFNPSDLDIFLMDYVKEDSEVYWKDSLNALELHPPDAFFRKSSEMLAKHYGTNLPRNITHEKHKARMEQYMEEANVRYGTSERERFLESMNDLRMSLKI